MPAKPEEMSPEARERVPVPDPTTLTTQQLEREVAGLQQLLMAFIAKLEEVLKTRLDGMDKGIQLVRADGEKIPHMVDEKIAALRAVDNEKFSSIQTQFLERDTRTDKMAEATSTAVAAALSAAKEAVGKTEMAFTKQIDQMIVLIQANDRAKDGQIADLKERLTRLESEKRGASEKVVETQAASNTSSLGIIAGIVGTVLGVGGLGTAALVAFLKH